MLYVSLMNDRRSNNINYTKRNSKPYFSNKYRTKPVSNLLRAEAAGIYIHLLTSPNIRAKTPPAIVRTMVEIICICINLSFSSESSLLSFKYRTSHRHGTKMNIAISATVITSSTGTSCKPPKKRKLCILNKQEVIIYTTSVNSLFIFFIPFPSPSRSFSGHPGS